MRYTTDGREVGPGDSLLPAAGVQIFANKTLQVRAYHPDYLPSKMVSATFFRVPKRIGVREIKLKYPPSDRYAGTGAPGLVDFQKGPSDFHDRAWMGFNGDDVDCSLDLGRRRSLKSLTVSLLADPGSWILAPRSIVVQASTNGKSFQEVGKLNLREAKSGDAGGQQYHKIPLTMAKARYLRVILENQNLPEWHPGAGTPAWIFVDELILE
jgi:hexosaminidase